MTRRLVIFDVDGTLVDSQAHIVASLTAAFAEVNQTAPERQTLLSIVGLSLPLALRELSPDSDEATLGRMVEAYKAAFQTHRLAQGAAASPLYAGAEETVKRLALRDDMTLAIATGKSRRGLDALMADWAFADLFETTHCADDHPSKPHPSMVQSCLVDCDVAAPQAVVVGDTTYDMEMARAARCAAIGVSWGYHGASALTETGARAVIDDFGQLDAALDEIWEG